MKNIKYFAVLALLLMVGCKKKDLDMTVLNKSLLNGAEFTEINVSDAWDVTIVQDEQTSGVTLEYSAFLEEYLNVTLTGKTLNIGFNQSLNLPVNTVIKAKINTKTFQKLSAKAAVRITLEGDFSGEDLVFILDDASKCSGGSLSASRCELQLYDASRFNGNLTADLMIAELDDDSRIITNAGQVRKTELTAKSASFLNMSHTPVEEAIVTMEDASEATLYVNSTIKGSLKSASTLYYYGHPTVDLDCDISSSHIPL